MCGCSTFLTFLQSSLQKRNCGVLSIAVVVQLPMQKIINSFQLRPKLRVQQQMSECTNFCPHYYYLTFWFCYISTFSQTHRLYSLFEFVPPASQAGLAIFSPYKCWRPKKFMVRQSFAWKDMKNARSNTWWCELREGGRVSVCLFVHAGSTLQYVLFP